MSSEEVVIDQKSINPEKFGSVRDRRRFFAFQPNCIFSARGYLQGAALKQQVSWNELALYVFWDGWKSLINVSGYAIADQLCWRAAGVFKNNYGLDRLGELSSDGSATAKRPQVNLADHYNWQFDANSSFCTQIGRVGCDSRSSVGSEQEIALTNRNYYEGSGEESEYERVKGNRVVPSSVPYNRQSLRKGFGRLGLISPAVDSSIGGCCHLSVLICLAKRGDKAAAKRKADDYPEDRYPARKQDQPRNLNILQCYVIQFEGGKAG